MSVLYVSGVIALWVLSKVFGYLSTVSETRACDASDKADAESLKVGNTAVTGPLLEQIRVNRMLMQLEERLSRHTAKWEARQKWATWFKSLLTKVTAWNGKATPYTVGIADTGIAVLSVAVCRPDWLFAVAWKVAGAGEYVRGLFA